MIKYECNNLKERKKYHHLEIELGWFRFSFYKMRKKFTVRFEISKGW
jgi:hypothetical protein